MVALASIGAGASAGAAAVVAGLIALRSLPQPTGPEPDDTRFFILAAATLVGLAISAATAWGLASPITDTWRRGVTTAVAAMLGFMLAAAAAAFDMVGGRTGLIVYMVVMVALASYSTKNARSAAVEQ